MFLFPHSQGTEATACLNSGHLMGAATAQVACRFSFSLLPILRATMWVNMEVAWQSTAGARGCILQLPSVEEKQNKRKLDPGCHSISPRGKFALSLPEPLSGRLTAQHSPHSAATLSTEDNGGAPWRSNCRVTPGPVFNTQLQNQKRYNIYTSVFQKNLCALDILL